MKIAYIVAEPASNDSGIYKKILSQKNMWQKMHHSVYLFFLMLKEDGNKKDFTAFSYKENHSVIQKYIQYNQNLKLLISQLKIIKPDIIYSRMFWYAPFLSELPKTAPWIMEINGNDVEEKRKINRMYAVFNASTRNIVFKKVSGFVFVTNELKNNKLFSKFNKKSIVISNGIEIDKKNLYIKENVNKIPTLCFISSPHHTWHGIDKVIVLAHLLSEINLHIIGSSKKDLLAIDLDFNHNKNVTVHGILDEKRASHVLAQCDVAISSLALHRIKAYEACPLKLRHYLAIGIPTIIGYKDTDLQYKRLPFILRIGNYENNVIDNIERIKQFIFEKKDFNRNIIQQFARKNFNINKKEKQRLKFFEQFLLSTKR